MALRILLTILVLILGAVPSHAEHEKIVLQLRWDYQFQFAGYLAAEMMGYYEDEGLDVEVRSAVSPDRKIASAIKEIEAGRAQFGVGGADILLARDKGAPLVVLATIFQQSASVFFALKETPVHSLADLTKLKVARRENDLIDVELQAMLRAEGIDPKAVIPRKHQPGAAHLLDGRVDIAPGYSISFPYELQEAGADWRAIYPRQYGIDFYGDSLFSTEAYVKEHPDTVERFIRASLKGWEYALANPDLVARRIATELPRYAPLKDKLGFNLFQIQGVTDLTLYPMVDLGHVNPARWLKMHEHMKSSGLVSGDLDIESFVFDPEAEARKQAEDQRRGAYVLLTVFLGIALVSGVWILSLRKIVASKTDSLKDEIQVRKETEQALLSSQRHYQTLSEDMPALVCTYLPDSTLLYVNRAYCDYFGAKAEDLVGKRFLEFIPEQDRGPAQSRYMALTPEDSIMTHIHRVVRGDQVSWQEWTDRAFFDAGGNLESFQAVGFDVTERIQAIEAATEFSTAFEKSSDFMAVVDREYTYRAVNQSYLDLVGLPKDKVEGNTVENVLGYEAFRQVKPHLDVCFEGREQRYDMSLPNDDGSSKELEVMYTPISTDDGHIERIAAVVRDVTVRRQAEAQSLAHIKFLEVMERVDRVIREASSLDHLIESVINLVFEVFECDRAWLLTPCDPETEMFMIPFEQFRPEYPGAGVLNKPIPAYDEDRQVFGDMLSHNNPVGSGGDNESPMDIGTGKLFGVQSQLLYTLRPQVGKAWLLGMHQCSYARFWEVEERLLFKGIGQRVSDGLTSMLILKELQISESHLQSIVARAPIPILIYNITGEAQFFNDRFIYTYGYTMDDVPSVEDWWLKAYPDEAYREEAEQEWTNAISRTMQHGEAFESQTRQIVCKNGELKTAEFNFVPLGEIGVVTAIDMTNHVKLMTELTSAKDLADQANRSKSEFLANMSHEIRTPLNGIMGMLQVMNATELSEDQSNYVDIALNSGKRLSALLSDILDLSRIESGRAEIITKSFNLAESVDQICTMFEVAAKQSRSNLECKMDSALPAEMLGDPTRVQQVLTNLVGNALKFSNGSRVVLEVNLLKQYKSGECRVLFTVSDSGIGIPDEKLNLLFKPFSQVIDGYTRSYQGAGLGLSICHRLVKLMNGTITVDSEEGVGSTFYVSIPFGLHEEFIQIPQKVEGSVGELKSLNVLLVEDEYSNTLAPKKLLEGDGHHVEVVGDGREALKAIRSSRFDVVVMDIQMPVMNGVEAAEAIRNGEGGDDNTDIPIIAMTAYAMSGDREKFLEVGMNAYLPKPLDISDLRRTLAELAQK